MRFRLVLFTFLFPLFALSAPKDFKTLMELSNKTRTEVAKKTSFEKKSQKLKKLEKELKTAMDEYEKINPDEGGDAEEEVAKFLYSLEPVMTLTEGKKPTAQDCEKAIHQVEFEDKGSRAEDATLTPEAQEALNWATLLCTP